MKIIILTTFFLCCFHHLYSQGDRSSEKEYISIFDESDLYINETSRTRINPYEETNNIAGGYINFGVTTPDKKIAPNQGNGIPTIPPTPDVPINRYIYFAGILGVFWGLICLSLNRKEKFNQKENCPFEAY
ncbi:MAG: hypothetical protein WCO54_05400 [Bacteroidota bacterium]